MVPAGYLAKRVGKPQGLNMDCVVDVYSVGACVNDDFADYINFWKHNGYWLFDSPEIIREVAKENAISLEGTRLFYYEVYEKEFDGKTWSAYEPDASFATNVAQPSAKLLEGFDVVTFYCRTAPEHSPLSCNGLAKEISTNPHCLVNSFEEAFAALNEGAFEKSEPGPHPHFCCLFR